jgi:hypothetical protein
VFRSKLKGYRAFRPFIAPADLSLSGGYVGAKRMLWFMAHGANTVKENEHAEPERKTRGHHRRQPGAGARYGRGARRLRRERDRY